MRKLLAIGAAVAMMFGIATLVDAAQPDFTEDFEDGDVAGWGAGHPLNGRIEAVATPVSPTGGNFVGKITFDGSCYGPSYSLDPVAPDSISWFFRADGDNWHGVTFAISDGVGGWLTRVGYHQGALVYFRGADQAFMPASLGTWYLIELKNIDWDNDIFDIWVDGVERVVGASFQTDIEIVRKVSGYACPGVSGPIYLDDITFAVNEVPTADAGGPYLVAVDNDVTFDGTGSSDPDNDPLTETWTADGGTVSGDTYSAGTVSGIYDVCLSVNDGSVDSDPDCTIVVVYDPSGGFVTGGGWIDSPAGAYVADDLLAGKASFGFVAKYKHGADVPDGSTEFQFKAGNLNFHSAGYEWLVVAGTKAQFRGEGTINGEGNYTFMLVADDDTPDAFRIHIWGDTGTVYDNGPQQPLGGGNIKIHKG